MSEQRSQILPKVIWPRVTATMKSKLRTMGSPILSFWRLTRFRYHFRSASFLRHGVFFRDTKYIVPQKARPVHRVGVLVCSIKLQLVSSYQSCYSLCVIQCACLLQVRLICLLSQSARILLSTVSTLIWNLAVLDLFHYLISEYYLLQLMLRIGCSIRMSRSR